ncbi:unnamed protein product [Closterium sp. NIES-65]|nr:unnamed protein product [Closterium sp. NIES-65]
MLHWSESLEMGPLLPNPTLLLSFSFLHAFFSLYSRSTANSTTTSMTVTGDNWQCSDVNALVGIPLEQFSNINTEIDCNQPLVKGSVLKLDDAPNIPCTAFFYALNGDTCSYVTSQLGLSIEDLVNLNPGLNSLSDLNAGQSVCVERSSAFAYKVPECLRYDTLTTSDTCEVLLRRTAKEPGGAVTGRNWADLYRNNPGLTCSSTIPGNMKVQICLRAEYCVIVSYCDPF